ncbi:unnamed protein product, partial [Ixodes pacificus]
SSSELLSQTITSGSALGTAGEISVAWTGMSSSGAPFHPLCSSRSVMMLQKDCLGSTPKRSRHCSSSRKPWTVSSLSWFTTRRPNRSVRRCFR